MSGRQWAVWRSLEAWNWYFEKNSKLFRPQHSSPLLKIQKTLPIEPVKLNCLQNHSPTKWWTCRRILNNSLHWTKVQKTGIFCQLNYRNNCERLAHNQGKCYQKLGIHQQTVIYWLIEEYWIHKEAWQLHREK